MSEVTDAPAPIDAASAKGPLQGSHIWYELITPDPEGAKKFYDTIVPGWLIGERAPVEHDYRMIGRSDGGFAGGVLRLTDEMSGHGAKPSWLGYVGVDDVDAAVDRIETTGGKVMVPAFDIEVGRIAMVADPLGNPFYVMKPVPPAAKPDAQSDVFSPDQLQRIGWNELSTPDPVAARQFYGELFGWGSDEFMDMGEYGEYRFLNHGGMTIGALCGVMPGGSPGWRYYIRVPSIRQAAEAIRSRGGAIAMGPHEVPGGDHIIIGHDPQGAEFALVGKA
jgi:predicted enzyme related to lactoylglutathione lyase